MDQTPRSSRPFPDWSAMLTRMFNSLPGPMPLRLVLGTVIAALALVALLFFYDWLGQTYLDTGGTIG